MRKSVWEAGIFVIAIWFLEKQEAEEGGMKKHERAYKISA